MPRGLNDLDLLDGQRQLFAAEGALSDSQLFLATIYLTFNKALAGGLTGKMPMKIVTADLQRPASR